MKASERLLASARTLAGRAREEIVRILASMRAWDRYLRMRVAVLATFGLLSVAAIGVARSGGAAEADNRLNAYVSVRTSALGWALLVHNQSGKPWRDVVIELDGDRILQREILVPDEKLVLSPWEFEGGAENRSPPTSVSLRVGRVVIHPPLAREAGE